VRELPAESVAYYRAIAREARFEAQTLQRRRVALLRRRLGSRAAPRPRRSSRRTAKIPIRRACA